MAYWPAIPIGHTDYSWNHMNANEKVLPRIQSIVRNVDSPDVAETTKKRQQKQQNEQKQKQKQKQQQRNQGKQNQKQQQKQKNKNKNKNKNKQGNQQASKNGNVEPASSKRRDRLLEIESKIQQLWMKNRVFEANPEKERKKFMCTLYVSVRHCSCLCMVFFFSL